VLYVMLGGAVGALARWALSQLLHRQLGAGFAWGTLGVNLLGCLLLGVVMQLSLGSVAYSRELRLLGAIGFLGAFTTFSTFAFETLGMMQEGAWRLAWLNIAGNVILGLALVLAGMLLGRLLAGGN
jgi:fluoride exporter